MFTIIVHICDLFTKSYAKDNVLASSYNTIGCPREFTFSKFETSSISHPPHLHFRVVSVNDMIGESSTEGHSMDFVGIGVNYHKYCV